MEIKINFTLKKTIEWKEKDFRRKREDELD